MWTPELEAAWAPLAGTTDLSPKDFAEALVRNLTKKGRTLDELIDQLRNGTMLDALTNAIARTMN